jgi:hypothetical protein
MAIEDAGVLALLIQRLCKPTLTSAFDYSALGIVSEKYAKLRIPRTTMMLEASHRLGDMQMSRSKSENWFSTWKKELEIKMQVAWNGTLPIMLGGSGYNYREVVEKELVIASKI